MWVVTASWSPPNAWPTVTVAASHPASVSPATAREKAAGSAPPSVMTYATRAPGFTERMPASTAGSAECRSATTTGIPPRSPGVGETVVVRAVLLVDGEQHLLHRGVAGLDDVAGPRGRVGGKVVGAGDDERQPTGTEALEQGRRVEQHPLAGVRGSPTIAV